MNRAAPGRFRTIGKRTGFTNTAPGITGGMTGAADEHGATVVPYEDGPLLVRGTFTLQTPDGQIIDPGRKTVALCRCGKSAIKPFCDGTHKAIGFRAGTGRDEPAPRNR
ncbi:CDGSH iron-sulfur domain-containing protein [Actinoplanes sp. TFC3]|uniref:CDGSH iron-sulfur domain-containing protein n=1 Tax=Actinoplanes sp. TFC3 TaxID=1710355 RepID=UPI001F2CDA4B|nr:CDGSH iron-sulfur domain-containing protein [Actinoplanes sp. TFC3]